MVSLLLKRLIVILAALMLAGCVLPLVEPDESRMAYLQTHPELDVDAAEAIRRGRVIPGMSREDVEACWGSPSKVDKSESIGMNLEWGEEIWEYRSNDVFTIHPEATVIFRNGKVVDVSPSYLSDVKD